MKINRLDDLKVFVAAAETGSFSAAARRLDLSPVVASAVIKRLEEGVGVRLFERSTRRVRLSEAGERFLPHAREALQALAWGEAALGTDGEAAQLTGPLRLSLPSDPGRNLLIGWIEAFLDAQPAGLPVTLELRISDRPFDLLQQPVDFAIRYGVPEDSGLVALPIASSNRRVLCASPAYLARHPEPQQLSDLAGHNCLRYFRGESAYSRWRFDGAQGPVDCEVSGDRIADDAAVVRQWALEGRGIAYKSELDVRGDLAAGRLVRLLPQLRGELAPLYLLVVSRQRLNAGIRALAAYLAERCAEGADTEQS